MDKRNRKPAFGIRQATYQLPVWGTFDESVDLEREFLELEVREEILLREQMSAHERA